VIILTRTAGIKKKLIEKTCEAMNNTHVLWGFQVGAAVLAGDGRIYEGCNVESWVSGLAPARKETFSRLFRRRNSQNCSHFPTNHRALDSRRGAFLLMEIVCLPSMPKHQKAQLPQDYLAPPIEGKYDIGEARAPSR
jgi:hypothetical protein